jgi:rSAM/selenodomain-associated transferase 1
LLGTLTARQACELQEACLADAVALVNAFMLSNSALTCEPWLYVAGRPAKARALAKTLGLAKHWRVQAQRGADLGARMHNAYTDCFRAGYAKVVIIGTDTPWMKPHTVARAFHALDRVEVVLGPARDGGYFLVGARRTLPARTLQEMFRGISWGSSNVLRRTIKKLRKRDVPLHLLPRDFDLDRPEDLARAARILRHSPHRSAALAKWIMKMVSAASESSRRR